MILTRPLGSSITFEGLVSRCPAPCFVPFLESLGHLGGDVQCFLQRQRLATQTITMNVRPCSYRIP